MPAPVFADPLQLELDLNMLPWDEKVFVIAEVGPNHDGSVEKAFDIIEAVAKAGADAIKFQTFQTGETVVSTATPLAPYMERSGASLNQNDLHDTLGLSRDEFHQISDECKKQGITFLSTPFDLPSVEFLQSLDVPLMKIPSGELTNPFLLQAIARTGLDLIMSTGMAELDEISRALSVIREEWRSNAQTTANEPSLVLLHCTSAYPTPLNEVNLLAMDTLRKTFNLPVGYSDHTIGRLTPVMAVARGARVIEKHVTPDPELVGPDHKASLPIAELPTLIQEVRQAECVLGEALKAVTASEKEVRAVARRSLAAARDIMAGECFEKSLLTALRPESGISPMRYEAVVGLPSKRAYKRGELIELEELED